MEGADQVPLLSSTGDYGRPSSTDIQKEESFYFLPNTPSQRSLMDVQLPASPSCGRIVLMACFPCFAVTPICSPERKQEYFRIPRSLSFFISFIQIIMFAIALGLGGFEKPRDNWLLGPTGDSLIELGAKDGSLMRYEMQVYRYITPIFLHAGFIQLIINVFGQIRMGLFLEKQWRWYTFLGVYVACGFAGVALGCDIQPNSISVASSAAFIGVMGAYFAQLQLSWFKMEGWQKRINLALCLTFILVTLLEGIGSNYVDSSGHLGGLAMGLILGYSIFGLKYARRWNPRKAKAVPVIGIFCILFYYVLTITLFYTIVPVTETSSA